MAWLGVLMFDSVIFSLILCKACKMRHATGRCDRSLTLEPLDPLRLIFDAGTVHFRTKWFLDVKGKRPMVSQTGHCTRRTSVTRSCRLSTFPVINETSTHLSPVSCLLAGLTSQNVVFTLCCRFLITASSQQFHRGSYECVRP